MPFKLILRTTLIVTLSFLSANVFAQVKDEAKPTSVVDSTDVRMIQVNKVLQEVFWRARANDYAVFYDYEFSYMRKEKTLDQYLTGTSFRQQRAPNSDSLVSLHLDSLQILADTMAAFITTVAGDGSDGKEPRLYQSFQTLYLENGIWIKPLSTRPAYQDEFDQKLESYRKAIERDEDEKNK
jgi:hypothetical protein